MAIDKDKLLELYTKMLLIRRFEERSADLLMAGEIPSGIHSSIGQEAVAVGVCANLRTDDCVSSTHRAHGHLIAKGGDIKLMMAELYCKRTGYCKGKGGSMHMADYSIGFIGACALVGGGLPVATGVALAAKLQGKDQVTVAFFGDGATNEGTFHESINLASIWNLPIVYVCENNMYAVTTPTSYSIPVKDVATRAVAYGIPGETVDGQDVLAVSAAAGTAVERARQGAGPSLLECKTYRYLGHFVSEEFLLGGKNYRTDDEINSWKARDAIALFGTKLMENGVLTKDKVASIEADIKAKVEDAVTFARQGPQPAPEEALEDLFV
ncbi:MAG: thiamine pyrophosphate-dependent dehydrogenase E1 component subunit alpha [Dehalococcoidia bacterium]|nr:thiamine pyrophosphate-dependent dehydrogenase E1 component subunit alpha [Dehalococcoidia bacterium]